MRIATTACLTALVSVLATSAAFGSDAEIASRLAKLLPEYKVESIRETPIKGLREVTVGPQVLYVSEDAKYIMQGNLIDLANREDLTEPRRAEARKRAVDKIGEDRMVIFAPDKYDHTVTVFTDLDCGYCRQLHGEIDSFGEEGVRVRYLFYPRAGVGSDSYKKAVSVWCADDRRKALTDAKLGKTIEPKTCDNPIKEHMQLGELLGVSGTPTMVLDNGELIPGYVPAKRLSAALGKER